MKKHSREINIFSMSALDLFASALGAFILITAVTIPYFPNTGNSPEEISQVKQELEEVKKALEVQQEQAEKIKAILGIKTDAKKFAIAVDMSGSINDAEDVDGDGRTKDYTGVVIRTLNTILENLNEGDQVLLIGFQGSDDYIELHLLPADSQYIRINEQSTVMLSTQIKNWMKQVGNGTPSQKALLKALDTDPEEIIILTDGAPNGQYKDVIQSVTKANKNAIPIHAVAIGEFYNNEKFVDFLSLLTKRNNGVLVSASP